MPPKLHIQFAAGALEAALAARSRPQDAPPSWTAHRDLERYYQLLADELALVPLTEPEALTIVAAARGWLIEPSSYRYLWIEIEDYLADQAEDTGIAQLDRIPRLDAAGRAVLVAKLRALSPGAALAVCDAVERYWVRVSECPDEHPHATLHAVGLIRED